MMTKTPQFRPAAHGIMDLRVIIMRYVSVLILAFLVMQTGCSPTGVDPVGDLIDTGDSNTGASGLSFLPTSLAFDSVVVGQASEAKSVTVTAETAMTVTAVTMVNSNFSLVETTCVKALAKSATCTMSIKFNPVISGENNGSVNFAFTLSSSTTAKEVAYGVAGTGTTSDSSPGNAVMYFSPQSIDFESVTVSASSSTKTSTITADFSFDVYLSAITLSNQHYSIVSHDCPLSPTALTKGSQCTVSMKFVPLSAGALSSSLKVTYGTSAGLSNLVAGLPISGTGVSQITFDGLESFTSTTSTGTTLNWTDNADASFYLIYRISSGSPTLVATQQAPASTYAITGLTPNTSYTYRVNAVNAAGDSDGNSSNKSVTTDAQGSFTAVADIGIAEGSTGSTAAFSCSDGGGNSPTYTQTIQSDSDSNCAINSGKVTCTAVNYKTGHAAWASNITVRCDLNGSSFTNTFAVNVSDTNRSPSLTAIGNQSIIAGAAITGVNADDGGDDFDVDLDALLYSCTYGNDQGTGAGTACASLPNSAYSFDTGTGALAWTSSTAAAVGNASTIYTFTITASDQQGAPLTDTETFTVTVAPSVGLTAKPDLLSVTSTALVANAAMTQIDYNNSVTGDDVGVTYTCHFDRTIDGSVTATAGNECDDDLDTYGTATFNTSTGVFDWTPSSATAAMFEFYITATIGASSANDLFVAMVQEQYTLTNLLSDLDARYATGFVNQSGAGDWEDLTSNNNDGNQTNGTWSGTGTAASPYRLDFNGTSSTMDMGTILNGQTKTMINTWINTDNAAQTNKVILSSGADTGNGLMVTQSPNGTGKLRLHVGTSNYYTLLNTHSVVAHWRMSEASGNLTDTIAGLTATASGNPTYSQAGILYDGNTAINFDGTGDYFTASDATFPSGANSRSVAMWIKVGATKFQILFEYGTLAANTVFGVRLNADGTPAVYCLCGAGTGATALNTDQWYFLAATFDGTTGTMYVDGEFAGSGDMSGASTTLSALKIASEGDNTDQFNGVIDEVTLFDEVLTPNEVRALYQAGIGCETTSTIAASQWNMVSTIFDSTTAGLLLNGRQECTMTAENTFAPSTNLTVGSTSAGANYWDGSISDVKTYSQGTSANAKTSFDKTADRFRDEPIGNIVTSNLVYHFDAGNYSQGLRYGGAGCGITSIFDLSASAIAGTLTNFAACGATTGFNGDGSAADPYRLAFDGTNDYVLLAAESVLNITTKISVEAWYCTSSGNNQTIMAKRDGAASQFHMHLPGTQVLCRHYQVDATSAAAESSLGTGGSFYDGNWHHIVCTIDVSSGAAAPKLYTDGALNHTSASTISSIQTSPSTNVNLGAWGNGAIFLFGDLAVARIYSKALSLSEVQQNYNAQSARYTSANCN